MATGSTASSGTEGPDPQSSTSSASEPALPDREPAQPGDAAPGPPHDAARRAFFLEFGKQAVNAVGQVAGMADVVSRTSSSAAASLLGLDEPKVEDEAGDVLRSADSGRSTVVSPATQRPAAEHAFHSPYRLDGNTLVLLDQRKIPEALEEVSAQRGADVAYYLRIGVVRGGPAMAQVAAYGLALTAYERVSQLTAAREVELRRTRRTLAAARSSSRLPAWAMARMAAAEQLLGQEAEGAQLAAALRAEADAIATEFQVHHAAIASSLTELLAAPTERPLGVLVHGNPGALSGGFIGSGLAALRQLGEAGRDLRVFVTETRPFMDGARLASWELHQAGIEHKVIPDAAAAWLFARETIDAVLLDAEWIAANGDVATVVGGRAIAQQAAVAPPASDGSRPRIIVTAASATADPGTADGAAIPTELRPARDLVAYLSEVPIRASDALVPATDVLPATTVAALVTERGVTTPLTPASIALLHAQPETEPG